MRYTLITRIRLIASLAALLFINIVSAQQNQKIVFPHPQGYITEEAIQVVNAPDGGWLLTGRSSSTFEFNNVPRLIKLDSDGLTQWDNTYLAGAQPDGSRITPTGTLNAPDGGWLLSMEDDTTDIDLMRVGTSGDLLWTKALPANLPDISLQTVSSNNTYYASSQKFVTGGFQWQFHELDQNGDVLNSVLLPPVCTNLFGGNNCFVTKNGVIQLFYTVKTGSVFKSYFARYDFSGNLLWESPQLPFTNAMIAESADGGILCLGPDLYLQRYDAQGVLVNESVLDPAFGIASVLSMEETPDGSIVLAGRTVTNRGVMAKLAADYSTIWLSEAPLDTQSPLQWLSGVATSDGWAAGIGGTNDAKIGFVRFFENTGVTIKTISGKVFRDTDKSCTEDANESPLKGVRVTVFNNVDYFFNGFSAADGSYQIKVPPGEFTLSAHPAQQFFFLCPSMNNMQVSVPLTGPDLTIDVPIQSLDVIHHITGTVKIDENDNCAVDNDDIPMQSWKVSAEGSGFSLTDYTDANGVYSMYMPDGTYTVKASPLNPTFSICGGDQTVTFNDPQAQTAVTDFPVQKAFDCGLMKVGVGCNTIRPCTTAIISVSYRNVGTAVVDDVKVTILLDPSLTYLSSSVTPLSVNGNVLVFDRGSVEPTYNGYSFFIEVLPDCNLTIGQQVCVTAHVEPDTLCFSQAGWEGAVVTIKAACGPGPNEASFTIKNIGSAPNSTALEYIITEEQVVLKSGTFQLLPGDSIVETVPISNTTQIGIAQQEPGYPGDTSVTYTLTNCIGMGSNPAGFNGPAGPFTAQSCFQVVNSFDPNDKQAQPLGFGPEHIVWPGTRLTYRVRFQNTGNDTAFLVVVRDSLSADLDPGTIELLGGSHPYRFDLLAGKIMQFTFDDIVLPDSLTNPEGSQGYLEFSIKHREGLPLGTNIGNSAAIYFDYNKPVITNTVWRKIDEYFTVSAVNTPGETIPVKLFPNPATYMAVIELPEMYNQSGLLFEMTDVAGRVVRSAAFTGPRYQLHCADLSAGVYFWRISDKGMVLTNGKIAKRDER